MRADERDDILATNDASRAAIQKAFNREEANLNTLLKEYADGMVSDDRDRRMMNDFQDAMRNWMAGARQVMALSAQGRREEARAYLDSKILPLGDKVNEATSAWIQYNRQLADTAGNSAVNSIAVYRRNMAAAAGLALIVSALVGLVTFQRIVGPIRGLQKSVNAIARGDYAQEIPSTKAADETGDLARAIDVLKQGAAAMEEQRWVKPDTAKITADSAGALLHLPILGNDWFPGWCHSWAAAWRRFTCSKDNPRVFAASRLMVLSRARPTSSNQAKVWLVNARRSASRLLSHICRRATCALRRVWGWRHRRKRRPFRSSRRMHCW